MRRDTAGVMTARELDLMNVLWEHGPGTTAEVRLWLGEPLAHTTVLTILKMLLTKRFVVRSVEGVTQRFHPIITRQEAAQASIRYLKHKLFCGSAVMMLEHVLDEDPSCRPAIRQMSHVLTQRIASLSSTA